MAKAFGKLTPHKLSLKDTITVGKYANCRVCDIINEDWAYILYMQSKAGWFNNDVIYRANELKQEADASYEEDNNRAILNSSPWGFAEFDDVPF